MDGTLGYPQVLCHLGDSKKQCRRQGVEWRVHGPPSYGQRVNHGAEKDAAEMRGFGSSRLLAHDRSGGAAVFASMAVDTRIKARLHPTSLTQGPKEAGQDHQKMNFSEELGSTVLSLEINTGGSVDGGIDIRAFFDAGRSTNRAREGTSAVGYRGAGDLRGGVWRGGLGGD